MADYSIIKRTSSEYNTSAWSGGTTTELGIGPEGSRYADREFLWRISSATVDLEESTFTALPDYNRIIMTLEGELDLCHNGGEWIHLNAFETHSFDGADDTVSRGKVVDFNLMTRKGAASGVMVPLMFPEDGTTIEGEEVLPEMETFDEIMIYCHRGPITVICEDGEAGLVDDGESFWLEGDLSGAIWNMTGVAGAKAVLVAVKEKE